MYLSLNRTLCLVRVHFHYRNFVALSKTLFIKWMSDEGTPEQTLYREKDLDTRRSLCRLQLPNIKFGFKTS